MSQFIIFLIILLTVLVVLKMILCEIDGRKANKIYNLRFFLTFNQPFKYGRTRSLLFLAFICFLIFMDFDITTLNGMLYALLFLIISVIMDILSQYAYYYYGKQRFTVGINKAEKVRTELKSLVEEDDYDNIEYPVDYFSFKDLCENTFEEDQHIAVCSMDGGSFISQLKKLPYVVFLIDQYKIKAQERLQDTNIKVTSLTSSNGLPFKDEKIDEYIVNYTNFDKKDVYRVLKQGGLLVLRHKGNNELKELVLNPFNALRQTQWNVDLCRSILTETNFEVLDYKEVNDKIKFKSIQSLLTYLKQYSGDQKVNIDMYLNQLAFINANIKQKGEYSLTTHEFYVIARKK